MITIENIALFLGDEKPKLKVNHLDLKNGLWALVGRNGVGKTTLLKAISGVNTNLDGEIKINNLALTSYSFADISKLISVVFSKVELFGNHTTLDILHLGRLPYQGLFSKPSKNDLKKINEVIALLQISNLVEKEFSVLSDGEKQLVMIGRALVQDTPILLLDEPTAFLDVVNRKKIIKLLSTISKNKLVIVSTHNIELIEQFCDGLLMITNNQLNKFSQRNDFESQLNKLFENEI